MRKPSWSAATQHYRNLGAWRSRYCNVLPTRGIGLGVVGRGLVTSGQQRTACQDDAAALKQLAPLGRREGKTTLPQPTVVHHVTFAVNFVSCGFGVGQVWLCLPYPNAPTRG
jgi:hypothetical protein